MNSLPNVHSVPTADFLILNLILSTGVYLDYGQYCHIALLQMQSYTYCSTVKYIHTSCNTKL